MPEDLPLILTFGLLPEDVPNPTLIIRREGGVKQLSSLYGVENATVLVLNGVRDQFGTTSAQRRAVEQLIRVVLNHNPLCEIAFKGGASPWALQHLHQAELYMELHELMQEPYIDERKYFHRRRRRHPIIRGKLRQRRQGEKT